MASRRFLLLCSLACAAVFPLAAQNIVAEKRAEPEKPLLPQPRITFNSVNVEGPYIAMTFDDGPREKLTPRLLDLLAARRIKATFFVIGQNAAEYPEILRRAAREGHEIANHTWSHPNLSKMSDEGVRRELQKTDATIKNLTGVQPRLMRPPYGSLTARQKQWIHQELGYAVILWDVDPLDWRRPGPMAVCNRIVKETRPGSIVLSHDIHAGTIEAMPATLDQLEARGFKFVTVSELLQMALPDTPKPAPSERSNIHATTSPSPPTSTIVSPNR